MQRELLTMQHTWIFWLGLGGFRMSTRPGVGLAQQHAHRAAASAPVLARIPDYLDRGLAVGLNLVDRGPETLINRHAAWARARASAHAC